MPTIRLSGTITSLAPILITRPEQGDVPLTMLVNRNETLVRVPVLPGETIKGLLRSAAYALCVDAAGVGAELRCSLDQIYKQTSGGLSFRSDPRDLGSDAKVRETEPLLSLFGAATPRITGRMIVYHALARPTAGGSLTDGIGLPPGMRRDAITARQELADLLDPGERALWARRETMVSQLSEARRNLEDATRMLRRARKTGVGQPAAAQVPASDIKDMEVEVERLEAVVAKIKDEPEFQHSVQRPVPLKNAAPAGVVYEHGIEVIDAAPAEIGLLLAALDAWNQVPRIGGGLTTGYGRIEASYMLQVLSDASLRRNRTWRAAGTITVGGQGQVVDSTDPVISDARSAWDRVEATIRTSTTMFV